MRSGTFTAEQYMGPALKEPVFKYGQTQQKNYKWKYRGKGLKFWSSTLAHRIQSILKEHLTKQILASNAKVFLY